MSPGAARVETVEVFNYTWPTFLQLLTWSAVVAVVPPFLVLFEPGFRDFLRELLGSWAFPSATALGVYAVAAFAVLRGLKWGERFKRPRMRPSLVADRAGITTQWSVRVPWGDVQDFSMANARHIELPSVLVSNIGDYRNPWWLSRTFGRWEPVNALLVLGDSKVGYLVRRGALGPLEHVGKDELIAELRKFRSHLGVGKGVRVLDHAQVESSETSQLPARPFVRLWDYATIAYFIGVLIALYLSTSRDWDWLPPGLLLAALSLVFVSFGIRAIYTGEVSSKGGVYYRSRNPIMYWFLVAITFFFGIAAFLGGISVIGQGSVAPASVKTSAQAPVASGAQAEAARLVMSGYQSGQENRPDEAAALFTRAIQLDPASAEAYYQRGAVYARRGSYEEAKADLKRVIELDPRHFESHRLIDWLLARQGAWDEIIGYWNRFIELEPNNGHAYLERAGAYRHKGDMQRALADLDKACGLGNQQACAIQRRR